MNNNLLKSTDLHVHFLQSLYPEDIFALTKQLYKRGAFIYGMDFPVIVQE
ncbi:hypothetical protein [Natronospora cellulosivora (SeqCode)]